MTNPLTDRNLSRSSWSTAPRHDQLGYRNRDTTKGVSSQLAGSASVLHQQRERSFPLAKNRPRSLWSPLLRRLPYGDEKRIRLPSSAPPPPLFPEVVGGLDGEASLAASWPLPPRLHSGSNPSSSRAMWRRSQGPEAAATRRRGGATAALRSSWA